MESFSCWPPHHPKCRFFGELIQRTKSGPCRVGKSVWPARVESELLRPPPGVPERLQEQIIKRRDKIMAGPGGLEASLHRAPTGSTSYFRSWLIGRRKYSSSSSTTTTIHTEISAHGCNPLIDETFFIKQERLPLGPWGVECIICARARRCVCT